MSLLYHASSILSIVFYTFFILFFKTLKYCATFGDARATRLRQRTSDGCVERSTGFRQRESDGISPRPHERHDFASAIATQEEWLFATLLLVRSSCELFR